MRCEQRLRVAFGAVAAGLRPVAESPVKQSGMRWTVTGANAIVALRRIVLSGGCEDFWVLQTENSGLSRQCRAPCREPLADAGSMLH